VHGRCARDGLSKSLRGGPPPFATRASPFAKTTQGKQKAVPTLRQRAGWKLALPRSSGGVCDLILRFGHAGAGSFDYGGETAGEFADAIRFVEEHGFARDELFADTESGNSGE